MAVLVTALCAAGLLAACSSTSNGSETGSGSSDAPSALKGAPIKIGMIADVGDVVNWPDVVAAGQGAVRAVNASGGINGHPVEFVFCNEEFNPNTDEACARQMVADKVIATAGGANLAAEADVDTILRDAGVPQIGNWSLGPSDTDPNSYLLFGGSGFVNAAAAVAASEVGDKKWAFVNSALPTTKAWEGELRTIAPRVGSKLNTLIEVPNNITDMSPIASAIVSAGDNAVMTGIDGGLTVSLIEALSQLGYKGVVLSGTVMSLQQMESLGSEAKLVLNVSPFPPVSATKTFPGLEQFAKDMAAEKASGDANAPTSEVYQPTQVFLAYAAVKAIQEVANAAHATTSAELKRALAKAKNVDIMDGLLMWTPSKSINVHVPRASTDTWYVWKWDKNRAVLVNKKPFKVSSLVTAGLG
jgi:branched-chain amino acid transport system substrate-binding protein